jgi:hypothetical protein
VQVPVSVFGSTTARHDGISLPNPPVFPPPFFYNRAFLGCYRMSAIHIQGGGQGRLKTTAALPWLRCSRTSSGYVQGETPTNQPGAKTGVSGLVLIYLPLEAFPADARGVSPVLPPPCGL